MIRPRALVAALVLLGSARAGGAAGLEGLVLLPDGTPAADATVSILGQSGSTRTGGDGRFHWVPAPRVPFSVLVVLAGGLYASPVLVEDLPEGNAPVVVRVRSLVSESVTVSAGATPHTDAPPASGAAIVGREELETRHPVTLLVAIDSIPGVSKVGEGLSAVPAIRGLARGRTLILIDGARVSAERRAGPSATFLDPFVLEAVEVSRGMGAVAYGSDAFGGVIHARTRRAPHAAALSGRLRGTLASGAPERSLGGELLRGWSDGGAIVQARWREFDDYRSPEGRVPDSFGSDHGFRARVDQELGKGRLHAGYQRDRVGASGKPAASSASVRTLYPREDSDRMLLGYEPDPAHGFSRLQAHGFLGRYRLVTDRDRLATPAEPRQLSRSDVRAWDYGLRLTATRPVGDWRLEAGLDLNGRRRLRALGSEQTFHAEGSVDQVDEMAVADAGRRDLAWFATLDGALLSRLTLSAGGRVDSLRARNRGGFFGDRSRAGSAESGFLALNAGPLAGLTLTAQVGRGYRDPTLSDRYFRGVTGRGFVVGNPELQPESSLQYDLALRRAGRVRMALYLYRYRFSELIERYRSGADFGFRNRGRARLQGAELELEAELAGGVRMELGAQAASGKALDDGAALDDVPEEGLTLSLRRRLGGKGSALLRAKLRAKDGEPGPVERITPGYLSLDASLSWRLAKGLEARLLLRNALDQSHLESADVDTVTAPGRAALLTLLAGF